MNAKRDFILAVSLANLCFLERWSILSGPFDSYLLPNHPFHSLILPLLCSELLLAALFFAGARLFRRVRSPVFVNSLRLLFLAVCVISVNSIRWHLFHMAPEAVLQSLSSQQIFVISTIIAVPFLWFIIWRQNVSVRAAVVILLVFAPLAPITLGRLAWFSYQLPPPLAFRDKPLAPTLVPKPNSPRFLWIIFDELDSRLVFDRRPKSVSLPEFDRFRSESLDATRVRPPANWTTLSVPSLLAGRDFSVAGVSRPDELLVTEKEGGHQSDFTKLPNVFTDARQAGFNTGIVGWHHPYGRLLNASLTACYWQPGSNGAGDNDLDNPTLPVAIWRTLRTQLTLFPLIRRLNIIDPKNGMRSIHLAKFVRMRPKAIEFATNRNLGLVLLHLPIPHPPGIYDRRQKKLSLDDSSDYLDNLALADKTLGDLRRAMEANGTWNETTILVSSDHPLRPGLWKGSSEWNADLQAATSGNQQPYVPFLLKMPGYWGHVPYEADFDSVLTRDLIRLVMNGDVVNPQQVAEWLDERRSITLGPNITTRLLN